MGPGGNDGNSGLTWALRKLTLNGAEDVPVAAGDTVYIGPGVYREMLTVDVAGGAGNLITYIGDVTGENTDGVGGIVRITGSNNDQTIVRADCIRANLLKNYRVFRGFLFDMTSDPLIYCTLHCQYWTVEDCVFLTGDADAFLSAGEWLIGVTIRRCLFLGTYPYLYAIAFDCAPGGGNAQNIQSLVENCMFISGQGRGIAIYEAGGVTARNSTFMTGQYAMRILASPPGGFTANAVNNCILTTMDVGVRAVILGEIMEDFNTFFANATDRTNVAVGGNSITFPPLFQPPILHAGTGQISGFKLPWWMGLLSEWSQVRAITGVNEPGVDLLGIGRPAAAAKNSWGSLQFHDMERDTGTVYAGAASMELLDAGRIQMKTPITDRRYTIRVWVYREANYAGMNPQLIIKQPGQADRITTDAGGAAGWNLLEDSFVPAALPPYLFIELVSNNTAVAGNYATYFDRLTVRGSPLDTGEMEQWLWDRQPFDVYGKVTPVIRKDVEGNIYSEINTRGDLLKVAP